jgi:hypothetical protein
MSRGRTRYGEDSGSACGMVYHTKAVSRHLGASRASTHPARQPVTLRVRASLRCPGSGAPIELRGAGRRLRGPRRCEPTAHEGHARPRRWPERHPDTHVSAGGDPEIAFWRLARNPAASEGTDCLDSSLGRALFVDLVRRHVDCPGQVLGGTVSGADVDAVGAQRDSISALVIAKSRKEARATSRSSSPASRRSFCGPLPVPRDHSSKCMSASRMCLTPGSASSNRLRALASSCPTTGSMRKAFSASCSSCSAVKSCRRAKISCRASIWRELKEAMLILSPPRSRLADNCTARCHHCASERAVAYGLSAGDQSSGEVDVTLTFSSSSA